MTDLLAAEGPDVSSEVVGEQQGISARSPLQLFWRRLRRDKVAMTAFAFIVLLILIAIFAPILVKLFNAADPKAQNYDALDAFGAPSGPSGEYYFGVDKLGRDVFSRR